MVSVQRIRRATPSATQGWKSAAIKASGELPISPSSFMPCVRAELPLTLLTITITVNKRVLARSRSAFPAEPCIESKPVLLIAGMRRNHCRVLFALFRDELFPATAQRHVLAGFLNQALAVVRVENHFPNHSPDH